MDQQPVNKPEDAFLIPEAEQTPSIKERAQERQMQAIRRAHKSIGSWELKMRKWFINRPLFAELYGDGKPSLIGRCIKTGVAAGAAIAITHFAGVIAAGAVSTTLAASIGGAVGGALLNSKDTIAKNFLSVGFLAARAFDSFRISMQLRKIDNDAWFDKNVSRISDHKFANTQQFLDVCKTIVESGHTEKTTTQLEKEFKLTAQHDMWAKDLAIRAAAYAENCEQKGTKATLWGCLNAGLQEAPWATKTISKLDVKDKSEVDQTAIGQFEYKMEYKNKLIFNRNPNILDAPDYDASAASLASSLTGRRTRLGSLSARFENKLLNNEAYQKLIANNAIGNTAAGLAFAATVGGAALYGQNTAAMAIPLLQMQSVGMFCSRQMMLLTPSFFARMIDRSMTAVMHFANRTTLKFQVSHLNRVDPWVKLSYDELKAHVEEKYNKQFDKLVRKEHSRIGAETMQINADYYVAKTLDKALEMKVMMPSYPLEHIVNGMIKEVCIEPSNSAPLASMADARQSVSTLVAGSRAPNLSALGRDDKERKNDSLSI